VVEEVSTPSRTILARLTHQKALIVFLARKMILIIPAAIGRAMSFLQQGFVVEA